MKTVKLLSIFVLLVGAIFLALNWSSLFPDDSNKDEFTSEDKIDISAECSKIRDAWEAQKKWSADLYKSEREDIDQSKAMGLFSREGYNTVNNCLRESAANKACDDYLTALHDSKDFSDASLQSAYKGVKFMKDAEKMEKDPRIQDVEKRHQLYTSIRNFVNSSHTITPHFDVVSTEWTSFASAQNSILTQARNYRQNPLFSEMSHISGFTSGLDEAKLKEITNPQRGRFYTSLSQQIINYFRSETPTEDKQRLLNQIYRNFTYQESDYGVDSLAMLKVTYGK